MEEKFVLMSRTYNTDCLLTRCFLNTTLALINDIEVEPLPKPEITCSKLTIEKLEQGVKYVQS